MIRAFIITYPNEIFKVQHERKKWGHRSNPKKYGSCRNGAEINLPPQVKNIGIIKEGQTNPPHNRYIGYRIYADMRFTAN